MDNVYLIVRDEIISMKIKETIIDELFMISICF